MIEPEDPWSANVSRFRVRDAHVTALPAQGEIFVQRNLTLVVAEGRQEALRNDHQGEPAPSMLEYFCRVTLDDAPEPQSWSGTDAQVVISGAHENGAEITIAGEGAIGFDDGGNLEIEFEKAPQMAVVLNEG